MVVPPDKSIGVVGCACIVVATLFLYLTLESDSWSTAPSVRSPPKNVTTLPPNFFNGDNTQSQAAFSATKRSSVSPTPVPQWGTDAGRSLRVADSWSHPTSKTSVKQATHNGEGFGYPGQPQPQGFMERLSATDLATLQTLPVACTTDLPQYLEHQSAAQANNSNTAYPLNDPATDVGAGQSWAPNQTANANTASNLANADVTLYNPHAKASQATFEASASKDDAAEGDDADKSDASKASERSEWV